DRSSTPGNLPNRSRNAVSTAPTHCPLQACNIRRGTAVPSAVHRVAPLAHQHLRGIATKAGHVMSGRSTQRSRPSDNRLNSTRCTFEPVESRLLFDATYFPFDDDLWHALSTEETGQYTATDSIGLLDSDDWRRFTLPAPAKVTVKLSNLHNYADLNVL